MENVGFVLIHGAGLGAWAWERVLPHLELPALAVDLPGRNQDGASFREFTLESYAKAVIEAIGSFKCEKLILVGHSVGGEIALRVAARLPDRVAGIVFIAGIIPPPGKSMVSLKPKSERMFTEFVLKYTNAKPPDRVIRAGICNDLDEDDCRLVLKRYSPESPRLFLDTVDWKLSDGLPRTYVMTLRDTSLFVPLQGSMIARLGHASVVTIDSGHLPMLSKPASLAALLNDAARHAS